MEGGLRPSPVVVIVVPVSDRDVETVASPASDLLDDGDRVIIAAVSLPPLALSPRVDGTPPRVGVLDLDEGGPPEETPVGVLTPLLTAARLDIWVQTVSRAPDVRLEPSRPPPFIREATQCPRAEVILPPRRNAVATSRAESTERALTLHRFQTVKRGGGAGGL